MHWRIQELSWLPQGVSWLQEANAHDVYQRTRFFLSIKHYGLNTGAIRNHETKSANTSKQEIDGWLSDHIDTRSVLVVFGSHEVCKLPKPVLLAHWRDMFLPSRDDIVIVGEDTRWVLFYCHEDIFEFGRNNEPEDKFLTLPI